MMLLYNFSLPHYLKKYIIAANIIQVGVDISANNNNNNYWAFTVDFK